MSLNLWVPTRGVLAVHSPGHMEADIMTDLQTERNLVNIILTLLNLLLLLLLLLLLDPI